ncbi:MAG TPA: hypothetical protein VFC44_08850, partial [Candidatus Saccharimonadales bacterium]|nr:hypothetical protein [Candidatus Saccharimonadales bacterium]
DLQGPPWSINYWREGDAEVDFVVTRGAATWAVEVKSGREGKTPGLSEFRANYPKAKSWIIGTGGIPLNEFFEQPAEEWFA